jgi:hypothetical protein
MYISIHYVDLHFVIVISVLSVSLHYLSFNVDQIKFTDVTAMIYIE